MIKMRLCLLTGTNYKVGKIVCCYAQLYFVNKTLNYDKRAKRPAE